MSKLSEYTETLPCDTCCHNKVCNVRTQFEETEIKTTHPYVMVTVKCTEFMPFRLSGK